MTRPRHEDVDIRRVGERYVLRFEDGSTAITRSVEDALELALEHASRGLFVVGSQKPTMRLPSTEALPYLIASALLVVGFAAAIWRAL